MSLLKQIHDKGAVLSWSPVSAYPNLVALGTKDSSGIGFDDYGGELEIHMLDFTDIKNSSSVILGKSKTQSSRFSSMAWSQMHTKNAEFPYGIIAGGMVDGSINVWDPAKLVNGSEDSLIASMGQHQGPVNGLQFNPHKESSHLLASGGSDSEIYVYALDKPDQPNIFIPAPPPNNSKHTAEVTRVAWNTQVAHILASSSQNGSTIIWDLRQKKAWCELRDPSGGCVSDVSWNPDLGLHLVTASGDDKNPVIKLWDLRSSTSLPLATLSGHKEGILSVSWCPNDPSLLLSCAKDNSTILWDLFSLQPVFDLPSGSASRHPVAQPDSSEHVFGGLASTAGQKRYHVSWSPCLPAVISACSFDRKVQFYSLAGAKSRLGRAPKWLRKPVGATIGFGGKLVSFDNQQIVELQEGRQTGAGQQPGTGILKIQISQVQEDLEVGKACDEFLSALSSGNFKEFCAAKANDVSLSSFDRQVWSLMKVTCFEKNSREELLSHLGFDSGTIAASVERYLATANPEVAQISSLPPPPVAAPALSPIPAFSPVATAGVSAESLFSSDPAIEIPAELPPPPVTYQSPIPVSRHIAPVVSSEVAQLANEMAEVVISGLEAEPMIRKALVVGNFAGAVDICLQAGLMAEALLLAQCGDPELCARTQAVYFEKQLKKKPFLSLLRAIMKLELMELVMTCNLSNWKETLALLCTYGKSEDFGALCESLASRLENEAGDTASAALCYMCASNVGRAVGYWVRELSAARLARGRTDSSSLQQFIEKVVMFTQSNPSSDLGPDCSYFFSEYATLLASQGRFDVAPKYVRGEGQAELVLRDRIFHATSTLPIGSKPPPFPFEKVAVNAPRAQPAVVAEPSVPVSSPQLKQPVVQQAQVSTQQPAIQQQSVTQRTTIQQQQPAQFQQQQTIQQQQHSYLQQQQLQQQQILQQQQQQQQQQHQQQQQLASQTPSQQSLPPGWLQLMDPATNRHYYVNQATGQSQWEAPAPVPIPAPQPVPVITPAVTESVATSAIASSAYTNKVGGVAAGYTNTAAVATQNLHSGYAQSPSQSTTSPVSSQSVYGQQMTPSTATANATGAQTRIPSFNTSPQQSVAPVAVVAETPKLPVADLPCVLALEQFVLALGAANLSPGDKRQLTMVVACHEVLKEKAASGELGNEVQDKLDHLVAAIHARNFVAASGIQTTLANTMWGQHKEWIKGLKVLIQLMSRK